MPEAVIIDAVRTPIGALGGVLSAVRPDDLAALVLRAIIDRTGFDPAMVEEVYMGCANQAGEDNRDVARMASLPGRLSSRGGGCDFQPAVRLWSQCRQSGGARIRAGEGDVFVAGGVRKHVPRSIFSPQSRETLFLW